MFFKKKIKPRYLVLENDAALSKRFKRWSDVAMTDKTVLTMLQACEYKEIKMGLANNSVLAFEPTKINFGQYNYILSMMYDMLAIGELGVKEIILFADTSIENEMRSLWKDRTKLDTILKAVQVYSINPFNLNKTKLKI